MNYLISNMPYRLLQYDHQISLERLFKRDINALFDKDDKIYKPYDPAANISSFVLKEVDAEDLENGVIYFNIDGHSIEYTPNEEFKFRFITRSPLYLWKSGNIEDLTPMQLRLLLVLTYNSEL